MLMRVEHARRYIVEILRNKKKYIYMYIYIYICACKNYHNLNALSHCKYDKKKALRVWGVDVNVARHARSHRRTGHIRDSFIDRKTRPFGL